MAKNGPFDRKLVCVPIFLTLKWGGRKGKVETDSWCSLSASILGFPFDICDVSPGELRGSSQGLPELHYRTMKWMRALKNMVCISTVSAFLLYL